MERVRIGIIGTSGFSNMFHLPILSGCQRAELAALCGRNQKRTQEIANQYKIPRVYTDYREMIEEAQIDAVVVTAPDDLHYEMTMAALDAGLHVLCEKPLANNANHARQMFEKAEQARLKHLLNLTWRWLPQVQFIKHLLDEGYLGRVYQANFQFAFGWRNQREYDWVHDGDRSNGVLGSLGSHMIDLARWLIGDIASVSALLATHVERESLENQPLRPTNDSAFVLIGFEDDAQACIQNSFVTHMADRSGITFSLYGEKGTLHTDYFLSNLNCVVYGALRGDDKLLPLDIPNEFTRGFKEDDLFAHFMTESIGPRLLIDSIIDGKEAKPNFYDGYLAQKVIDAALKSQLSGQRVTISECQTLPTDQPPVD
jgi:predicted dehydrogenase